MLMSRGRFLSGKRNIYRIHMAIETHVDEKMAG